ncbi:hypothetical protein M436DRAFT_81595 [Aureobasidium namibiae CBS 147.97]|uniref:Uncharacterized protein n=1 Tax=Aureobasidium namibiae CBS 147.97 TaxID=1043004 RepID=A0A074WJI7_9PEZI
MSDLQFVIDSIDESHASASGTSSEQHLMTQKASLEGRMRQICEYIQTKRSYIDFLSDYAALRVEEHKDLDRLIKDYQLYSPNLDGSIQEILERVADTTENGNVFLTHLAKREKDEVSMLISQVKEVYTQWLPLMLEKLKEKCQKSKSGKSKLGKEDTKV